MRKNQEQLRIPSGCFFVILFAGRAGSSYVVSCLNRHPGVLCYPEILDHQEEIRQKRILEAVVAGNPVEAIHPYATAEQYYHRPLGEVSCLQAVGFKAKIGDIHNLQSFFTTLGHHAFKLIYLKRENIIKSVVSVFNAWKLVRKYGSGHWNASQKGQVQESVYIHPDQFVKELGRRIEQERWHETFFETYEGDKQLFSYEDMLRDEAAFFSDLLGFLRLDVMPLKGRFLKNTSDKLSQAIVNYDEIRSLFDATYFEQFFEDGCV